MTLRFCIADGWKDKQSQIYSSPLLGWVSNQFLHHIDVMDFQLQNGGTFSFHSMRLWVELSIYITRPDTSRNYSQQKCITLVRKQQRWQQNENET